jgi:peroxiredoxin
MKRHVGLPAIAFTLEDTAGTVHRLEQFRDRWLLMVFHRHLG